MITYVKIKIVSLAAESKLIRDEEKKFKARRVLSDGRIKERPQTEIAQNIRRGLYEHRVKDVRTEARAALVAYGYLRGKTYRQIENNPLTSPYWSKVVGLIKKYGDNKISFEDVMAWAKVDEKKAKKAQEQVDIPTAFV